MNNHSIPNMFKTGYRILMLMKRTKDGGTDNDRRCKRLISTCADHWDECWTLLNEMRKNEPIYRIYSSVNSRNIDKAIREFKTRQLNFDYDPAHIRNEFYLDSHNRFISCLAKPSCKNESYFLVDCDNHEEYLVALEHLNYDNVLYQYPTRNGYHFITQSFNPVEFPVSIQKDGMLLVSL